MIGGGSGATAAWTTGAGGGSATGTVTGDAAGDSATTGGGSGTFWTGAGASVRTVLAGSTCLGFGGGSGSGCDSGMMLTMIGFAVASARRTGAYCSSVAIRTTWTRMVTAIP